MDAVFAIRNIGADAVFASFSAGTTPPPSTGGGGGGVSNAGGVSYVLPKDVVAGTGITTVETDSTVTINATGGGSGSATWGGITGTLSDQTDLLTALNNKANSSSVPEQFNPIAGTNILLSGTYPNITFATSDVGSHTGNASINFGSTPGTNITYVSIIGQSDITSTSKIKAFIMLDTTATHNSYEHMIAPIKLTCGNIVNGVGFDIYAVTDWRLTGTFNITWEWI